MNYKCVFVGKTGAGKTSMVNRIISDKFNEFENSTIGVLFNAKQFKICDHDVSKKCNDDKCFVRLDLWDTAGQERFSEMIKLYYRGASLIILVFSLDQKKIVNYINKYYQEIIKIHEDPKIILVGAKSDIYDAKQHYEEVKQFVREHDCIIDLCITSSKKGSGINEFMNCIKDNIKNKKIVGIEKVSFNIEQNNNWRCC
jgi:small GTP-binding protein